VERLVRPDTGELVGALVPRYGCDRRAMRERGYTVGSEVRAELKKRRNVKFHRLAHAIGAMCVDQLDTFAGLDAHAAIKRLQRETGVCCEEMALDLGPLGTVAVKMPRSMAFDEMGEDEFSQLVEAIYKHLAATYWPSMTPEAIAGMADMYEGQG
jgi:hypothetical protein